MKPYSGRGLGREQRITNYRFSRGCRVVENGFGILAQRWQVLLTTMLQLPDVVRTVVEACVCLHNLMRSRYPGQQNIRINCEDDQDNLVPGAWRADANMHEVTSITGSNRDSVAGKKQREYLKLYFNSPAGMQPWQDRMIDAE